MNQTISSPAAPTPPVSSSTSPVPRIHELVTCNTREVDEFIADFALALREKLRVVVSVLDVGCGQDPKELFNGSIIHDRFYHARGISLVGIDPGLHDSLEDYVGEGICLYKRGIEGDLSCLGTTQFNVALFSCSSGYISKENLEVGAKQCAKRIPFGGYVVISEMHPELMASELGFPNDNQARELQKEDQGLTFWLRSKAALEEIFGAANFKLRELHDFCMSGRPVDQPEAPLTRTFLNRVYVFEHVDPNAPIEKKAGFSISLPQLPRPASS